MIMLAIIIFDNNCIINSKSITYIRHIFTANMWAHINNNLSLRCYFYTPPWIIIKSFFASTGVYMLPKFLMIICVSGFCNSIADTSVKWKAAYLLVYQPKYTFLHFSSPHFSDSDTVVFSFVIILYHERCTKNTLCQDSYFLRAFLSVSAICSRRPFGDSTSTASANCIAQCSIELSLA